MLAWKQVLCHSNVLSPEEAVSSSQLYSDANQLTMIRTEGALQKAAQDTSPKEVF